MVVKHADSLAFCGSVCGPGTPTALGPGSRCWCLASLRARCRLARGCHQASALRGAPPLLACGAAAGLGALLAVGRRRSQFLATWQPALQASGRVLGARPVTSAVGPVSGARPAWPARGGPSPPSVWERQPRAVGEATYTESLKATRGQVGVNNVCLRAVTEAEQSRLWPHSSDDVQGLLHSGLRCALPL